MENITELINKTSLKNEEILKIIEILKSKIIAEKEYHELALSSSQWKGTGKCWVQEINDGKRGEFVEPYNVDKPDRSTMEKIYRLSVGEYLINTKGSKSQDHRYKLKVLEDFTTIEMK